MGSCRNIPYEHAEMGVTFGSSPERVEELIGAVYSVIDSITAGAISDSNMTKIREISARAHETALRENGPWLGAIIDADEDGRDQRDFLRRPAMVNAITKEQLRDAARAYLRRTQVARITLLPESTAK